MSTDSPTRCCRRSRREGLADAVDGFCEDIAFSPAEIARVFDAAKRLACRSSCMPISSPTSTARRWRRAIGALSADHLEYTDDAGAGRHGQGRDRRRRCCPAPSISSRETQDARRSRLFRRHGVAMAVATDCNPGTSPLTSLLLAMNMAATLFRMTVEECLAGVTREAARALGVRRRDRHAGDRQVGRSRDMGHRAAGRTRLPRWGSTRSQRGCGGASDRHRSQARRGLPRRLAGDLSRRGAPRLDPSLPTGRSRRAPRPSRESSPRASRSMASTPASASSPACASRLADLATLQRNIVLSHAAGVGEAMPVAVVRLMMALKLASLAQGASGVTRCDASPCSEAMLSRGLTPVVPAQGSVGASGDLAPLAHMTAAMIGVGEICSTARACRPAEALARAGLAPLALGPKEGLALLNGTQFSTAHALAGAVRGRAPVSLGAGHRRAFDRRGARLRRARSMRASTRCAAIAARSRPPARCAR